MLNVAENKTYFREHLLKGYNRFKTKMLRKY